MYKIEGKKALKIGTSDFSSLGIKERYDIQEWIANDPSVLEYSSDLLIIQKEFSGFENTNNRLDLLALDKQGNLVIIENKRDDTGKDVVWQAINYASFCSTLTSEEVIGIYQEYLNYNNISENAEEKIADFFNGEPITFPTDVQKIILVARVFRKEVLSAVQWLNNNGIDISCIRFSPYKFNDDILLEVDRILPQDDIKDYTMKLAKKTLDIKNQKEKYSRAINRNIEFWRKFSRKFAREGTLFENVNSWETKKDSWIGASARLGCNATYNFVISDAKYHVELYFNGDKENNKKNFDVFYEQRDEIEHELSNIKGKIVWDRLEEKDASRISIVDSRYKIVDDRYKSLNYEDWDKIIEYLIDTMDKFVSVMGKYYRKK